MTDSVASIPAWRYLESVGCIRTVHQVQIDDTVQYNVEIYKDGHSLCFARNQDQSLANDAVLIEALQVLRPASGMN